MKHRISHSTKTLFAALAAGTLTLASPALGQVVNENIKLTASDGEDLDTFGYSITIDNNIIAIGAPHDDNPANSGSVYLYNATTGAFISKLQPTDGLAGDKFGWSVAMDNDIVAIGAPYDDHPTPSGSGHGSAYLFNATTGTQIVKLIPSDSEPGDIFGYSIAIDDGIVAVGAHYDQTSGNIFRAGSVYLFNTSGAELTKLTAGDPNAEDIFGVAVAIDNGLIAIGSSGNNELGGGGAAYIFNATTYLEVQKLVHTSFPGHDGFGRAIDIHDGIVAVGAPTDSLPSNGPTTGAAYLFDALLGTQLHKVVASDQAHGDSFGHAISIEDNLLVVGARHSDNLAYSSGSAYLYNVTTGSQIAKLLPSDADIEDQFGFSTSTDNGIVAIGANRAGDGVTDVPGAVYVFNANTIICPADFNGDGSVNFFDVDLFTTLYNAEDPRADLVTDGLWNFFDVSAYLALYAAGCP